MQDRNEDDGYRGPRRKPPREAINIQFARGLSSNELIALLQEKLIIARNQTPKATEISLITELVHDIKFRLGYYARVYGEVDRDEYDAEPRDS